MQKKAFDKIHPFMLKTLIKAGIERTYQQVKDMKIWQQVLAQQMKPLISPILMILIPQKPLHS